MPKIVKDNHDGTYSVYTEKEWLQRNAGTGVVIVFGVIGLLLYFLISNLINTRVIKDFSVEQYFSNITHFYGGDRCVWIAGDSLDTATSIKLYAEPDVNSRVLKSLTYPVMVKYRGKDSAEETVFKEYSTYQRPIRWSAVTIYNDEDILLNGYLKRGLDDSVHESHHFSIKENLVNVYSSDFARHYNFDNKKLHGNRYSLYLDVLCEPSLVENK